MKKTRTYLAKKEDFLNKKWYLVDASGKTLGRLATKVASIIRGKQKPTFTPSVDTGDFVVVINAKKIKVTGKKMEEKMYFTHSGYPGGDKNLRLKDMLVRHPERVIELAVWGMIPKHALGRKMIQKLKVYRGEKHPHAAQNPEKLELAE